MSGRVRFALLWLAVLVATFAAYRPALEVGWIFDDRANIVSYPSLHWESLSDFDWHQLTRQTANPRRIVSNVSFGLNHIVSGLEPWSYHLVNVLLHLAVGTALFWVIGLYLRGSEVEFDVEKARIAAVVAAGLFLLHPLNLQAVSYVVQRMTVLAALFGLLAFGSYLKARQATTRSGAVTWLCVASFSWVLGLLSKENVAALVPVVLLWEWCFHFRTPDARREWWDERSGVARAVVMVGASLLLVAGSYLVLRHAGSPLRWGDAIAGRDFNKIERLLTQARVGVFYLTLMLWPSAGRTNFDHEFVTSRGLFDPATTALSIAFWVAALVGAVALVRRRPYFAFPLLAYVALHAVEAGPLNLEMIFEHRMYLPMAMLSLFVAAAVAHVAHSRFRVVVLSSSAVAVLLGATTYARNDLWARPLDLFAEIARKSPGKPRAQALYAEILAASGRPGEAVDVAKKAVELDPAKVSHLLTLGEAYRAVGQPLEALSTFERAALLAPESFEPQYRIGLSLAEAGDTLRAFNHLMGFGVWLSSNGRPVEAIFPFNAAVQLDPEHPAAHNQLGSAYLISGNHPKAVESYRTAVRLDPSNPEPSYNLALTLERMGLTGEAVDEYRRFLEIAPASMEGPIRQVQARLRALTGGG